MAKHTVKERSSTLMAACTKANGKMIYSTAGESNAGTTIPCDTAASLLMAARLVMEEWNSVKIGMKGNSWMEGCTVKASSGLASPEKNITGNSTITTLPVMVR